MSKVRETVDRLLADFHDDHNWALWARYELDLAIHQDDGCPVFRKDCDICTNKVTEEVKNADRPG